MVSRVAHVALMIVLAGALPARAQLVPTLECPHHGLCPPQPRKPSPTPPPPATANVDWTGGYIGAAASYDWQHIQGFAGGYAGYNWQFGQLVFGFEGHADSDVGIRFSPNSTIGPGSLGGLTGSIEGRFGYTFDRLLLYFSSGPAVATRPSFQEGSTSWSTSPILYGWSIGAGVDYAFGDHLTGRLAYRYRDFGNADYYSPAAPSVFSRGTVRDNTIMVGLSWRFDGK